jgi:hypothetical protein
VENGFTEAPTEDPTTMTNEKRNTLAKQRKKEMKSKYWIRYLIDDFIFYKITSASMKKLDKNNIGVMCMYKTNIGVKTNIIVDKTNIGVKCACTKQNLMKKERYSSLRQGEIKSTFFNGIFQEEVCVDQPPGFEVRGRDNAYKLKKPLYELKQDPRALYN